MPRVLVMASVRTLAPVCLVRRACSGYMLVGRRVMRRRHYGRARRGLVRSRMRMMVAMAMPRRGRMMLMSTVRAVIIPGLHGEFLRDDRWIARMSRPAPDRVNTPSLAPSLRRMTT
ncbi:MAG TPA: hypothetical protein VJ802_16540 [Gemmatimonadaceae bacterium]|nr:hypothetical protein [Gemmatimonadaceae bacterium]